ncbi:MAG: hypothetical protein QOK21_444, partial [Solirubrobacteraceae bacterium]|nr:hypothetical protein [Solirubrobacteraceae bacterium]
LVLGLAALVVLSERRLGEPVGAVQRWAVAAAALAVVAIVAGGPTEHARGAVHSTLAFAIVGAVFAAGLLAGRVDARGWVLAAAVGETGAVLAAKLALTALPDVLPAAGWAALAGAAALVALQAEMAALRTLRVALVGPLVLVGQTALPVALAPLVIGERWARPALVVTGLLLAAGACAVLGRTRQP